MSFLAFVLAGIVGELQLPVSLLPDIDIPEITISIEDNKSSAREINTKIINPLRIQLLQTKHLERIEAEAKHGKALLTLYFEHGTKNDFAFLEVSERVERAMEYLPRGTKHPIITKKSVSDIPVFYLHCKYKSNNTNRINQNANNYRFLELSNLVSNEIKKRIEQLAEIAVADISGTAQMQINIIPDIQKMDAAGLAFDDIANAIKNYNISEGILSIKDKQFQYTFNIEQKLDNINDIKNLYFGKNNKTFQLKEFATVEASISNPKGATFYNHERAVTIALIKQPDAQSNKLKQNLETLLKSIEKEYPEISFDISRNQTKILDDSLSNLKLTILSGALLAFFVLFLFMRNIKAPLLIGISIPVSLIISFLFFSVAGLSLNIISLSGITLGIGMMIDNSIIVIDNINRYNNNDTEDACIMGTNEVISPLLSSALTTIAIFLPLSLLSGKAGALFYEQAMAVTVTLMVSYIVSITLLPVLYKLFYKNDKENKKSYNQIKHIEILYDKTSKLILRNQRTAIALFFLFIFSGIVFYNTLPKSILPKIEQNNFTLDIDWGEQINLDENIKRAKYISNLSDSLACKTVIFAGGQDFIVGKNYEKDLNQSNIYFEVAKPELIPFITQAIETRLKSDYPKSDYSFSQNESILSNIFSSNMTDFEIRLRPLLNSNYLLPEQTNKYIESLKNKTFVSVKNRNRLAARAEISYIPEKMMIFDIGIQDIVNRLKILSGNNHIADLKANNVNVPINSSFPESNFLELIENETVTNKEGNHYPLKEFISINYVSDFNSIHSDNLGEYFPVKLAVDQKDIPKIEKQNIQILQELKLKANLAGNVFENKKLILEFAFVLLVSFLLLYFILAAQFESIILPVIILLELPADIAGSFLFLKLFGLSLNIMSLTGIIVMAGIIINDSILKIDTMNQIINNNSSVLRALKKAGHIRLNQILMTSLTTILAISPFLFFSGLGSDLQKPLVVALLGGMFFGTVISLFYIPLFFLIIKKKRTVTN